MEELEYKVNELTFKPTHEFKKFVISLSFKHGNYGTDIIYFKPCMSEDKFLESEEILKQLLEEFFKNPSIFVSYWSKSMTIQKIKNWVENMKFYRFEFRLHDTGTSSGSWKDFMITKDIDESIVDSFRSHIQNL